MDEKKKKFWDEYDTRRKEKFVKEQQESLKQGTENEIDNLKSEIERLDNQVWENYEWQRDGIIDLRNEIDSLKEELISMKRSLETSRLNFDKEADDNFITLFSLIQDISKIEGNGHPENERFIDEKWMGIAKKDGIDTIDLFNTIRVDLLNLFPHNPSIIENVVDLVEFLSKDNSIKLDVKNFSIAIEIFNKLNDWNKAEKLVLEVFRKKIDSF